MWGFLSYFSFNVFFFYVSALSAQISCGLYFHAAMRMNDVAPSRCTWSEPPPEEAYIVLYLVYCFARNIASIVNGVYASIVTFFFLVRKHPVRTAICCRMRSYEWLCMVCNYRVKCGTVYNICVTPVRFLPSLVSVHVRREKLRIFSTTVTSTLVLESELWESSRALILREVHEEQARQKSPCLVFSVVMCAWSHPPRLVLFHRDYIV